MAGTVQQRIYAFAARHQTAFNVVGWSCFALICADYARFIALPDFITLPAAAGGILMGARYLLWNGVIKPRFEGAKAEENGRDPSA